MNMILVVAIGGAARIGRSLFHSSLGRQAARHGLPWGTLAVNVLGSFTMGVLVELFALRWSADSVTRAFLTIGVLGGYTTFSSFSLDMMVLVQRGDTAAAGGYLFASLVVSFAAIFGGLHLVRWMLA